MSVLAIMCELQMCSVSVFVKLPSRDITRACVTMAYTKAARAHLGAHVVY